MSIFMPKVIKESQEIKQFVNEAYFGDKQLEPILQQLHKLREPYLEKDGLFTAFLNEFNTDPELFKLNRMLEDQFGFKTCSITLINNKIINGYTYPISYRDFGSGKNLVTTKNGFNFKPEAEYCLIIFVYSGCMLNPEFTDREIMGMLLHEIGHNFSSALSDNLCSIRDLQHLINIPIALLQSLLLIKDGIYSFHYTTKVATNINIKFRKQYPELYNFIDKAKGSLNIISFIFREINDVLVNISILTNPISMIINNITRIIKNNLNLNRLFFGLGGKKDEQIADNFATMYGYGPDNNSFLYKAEELAPATATRNLKDTPFFGILQQMVIIPIECTVYALDPHPKSIYRAMDASKYLEMELNNSTCDPKMKKEIEKEIKELNKILNQYTEKNFKLSGVDVRAAYNQALIDLYDKKDRKNIERIYDDIDKKYKR